MFRVMYILRVSRVHQTSPIRTLPGGSPLYERQRRLRRRNERQKARHIGTGVSFVHTCMQVLQFFTDRIVEREEHMDEGVCMNSVDDVDANPSVSPARSSTSFVDAQNDVYEDGMQHGWPRWGHCVCVCVRFNVLGLFFVCESRW